MNLKGKTDIDRALQAVGEILASEGHAYSIVIMGGAALNLLGILERATTDVDILAFARLGPDQPCELLRPPEPLPEPLLRAAHAVARDMGLDQDWLNSGPALQWDAGLPPGLAQRVHWRRYAVLDVGAVGRQDLISFKLFAAADSAGTESVHYQDLIVLRPTDEELEAAIAWVSTQDASPVFAEILTQVIERVQRDLSNED